MRCFCRAGRSCHAVQGNKFRLDLIMYSFCGLYEPLVLAVERELTFIGMWARLIFDLPANLGWWGMLINYTLPNVNFQASHGP